MLNNTKRKWVIASNNKHKVDEIRSMLPQHIELVCLSDIGCNEEIPEDADTLEGNALEKAKYVFDRFGLECFADDTGLEVMALRGKPGVHSARYSLDTEPSLESDKRSEANIRKLLMELEGIENRKAAFRTVICFYTKSEVLYFEGKIEGTILDHSRGKGGFGYDAVFVPFGFDKTFAELPFEIKNKISHRAIATQKLITYLSSLSH